MDWLWADSVDDLKKLGKMNEVKSLIKKDIADLFKDKKSKDKNIVEMIKVTSGSWKGLYDKVTALREVIFYLGSKNNDSDECNDEDEKYFKSKADEYIFYLLELDGKQRADKLNITMKCYSDKSEAKKWRDSIAKVIHPDKCNNERANESLSRLNQFYKEMLGDE